MGARFWVGTGLGALVGAAIGVFYVVPFGLIVLEWVIFPVALVVAGVLASVGGGLAANRLAGDGSRTEMGQVAAWTVLIAGLYAVGVLLNEVWRESLLGPGLNAWLVRMVGVAAVATIAAGRFRRGKEEGRNPREGRVLAGLLVGALVSVPVVVTVAWLFGAAGA